MRIIHTADIHLDRAFAATGLPPAEGGEARAHLRAVLAKILQRASTWPADAVVISGDLFEYDRVTRDTVNFLRDTFSALAPLPVFICPGRHDACRPDSPYLTDAWAGNVHIFCRQEWQSVALDHLPLTIHGFAWEHPEGPRTLPATLEIPRDGRAHAAFGYGMADAILHGAALEPARFDPAFNLPAGLAYVGLGELHVTRAVHGAFDVPLWYAGAPEGLGFDDCGPHQYLEIELVTSPESPENWQAAVTPRPASPGRFFTITVDCSQLTSGQDLIDLIRRELPDLRESLCARVVLEGALARAVYDEMDSVREALADEVRYLQWRDTCQVSEDFDALARERTSLGAFISRIGAEIGDAPTHALRLQRLRSRDLGLCAYRGTDLPIRGITGEYR